MMYSEFIERTGYAETYITHSDYATHIEPIYMNADHIPNKDIFCKLFYEDHNKKVNSVIEMLIKSKSTNEILDFISGQIRFEDINFIHDNLKDAFLKTFRI